jgi:hypothetical protein
VIVIKCKKCMCIIIYVNTVFSNRFIAVWNSLRNTVVSAKSTNTFKNRSDKFWVDQDVKFNWRADITGIGSRSNYS